MKNSLLKFFIDCELKYGPRIYNQLPVVLKKGMGPYLYDINDKKYFDFISGYLTVNQGHCHPDIYKALIEQAKQLTICARVFHNNKLGLCEKFLASTFDYDMALMMNSGSEANETAYKICRKWGYEVKNIPQNLCKIIFCNDNFSGRTLGCVSSSTTKKVINNFGPMVPNFIKIPYNNIEELERELKDPNVCAFFVEPIQGEAGVIIPDDSYLKTAFNLCKKHNVLFVTDEVQTGLGRTGKMLCSEHYDVKADIVLLGKSLSGGFYPISAVLGSRDVMTVLKPEEHGSTYGGNPLACAVCMEAVNVIIKENLCERSEKLGSFFLESLKRELSKSKIVKDIRGKGLFCAIEFDNKIVNTWDICMKLMENGFLTRSHDKTIRLSPPLCITMEELKISIQIIVETVKYFDKLKIK